MEWRPTLAVGLIVIAGAVISIGLFPVLTSLDRSPSVTQTNDSTVGPNLPSPNPRGATQEIAVYRVGAGSASVSIQVVNDGSTNLTVAVVLTHNRTGSVLVSRTAVLAPYETVGFELAQAGGYRLAVTDEATKTTSNYTVSRDQFDCNDHSGTVRIDRRGRIETETVSTTMGCGSPPF
jgi:hypothetical protein